MSMYLLVDGIRNVPETAEQDQLVFRLDLPVQEIRLIWGRASPLDLIGVDDAGRPGVALHGMQWRQDETVLETPIASPGFIDGFDPLEHYNDVKEPFRWTNGNAALPAAPFPPWRGATRLHLHLNCWQSIVPPVPASGLPKQCRCLPLCAPSDRPRCCASRHRDRTNRTTASSSLTTGAIWHIWKIF